MSESHDIILCPTLYQPPKGKTRVTITATAGPITQMPSGRGLLLKDVLNLKDLLKNGEPFKSHVVVGYGKTFKDLDYSIGDTIEFQATTDKWGNLKNPSKARVVKRKEVPIQR